MNIKKRLRAIRIKIGKFLLDKKKNKSEDINLPKKILFLRQDGKIGDYIVSSFVFRELKKQQPNIHIGVVCTEENAFLFEQNNYIDQLYFVKKRNLISIIKCGLILRKEKYDAVIEPTVVLRNRDLLLLRLINAENYVGYQKSHYNIFNINIQGDNLHFSEIYKLALKKLGLSKIDSYYDIPSNLQIREKVLAFLKQNNINQFIAINFYGSGSSRRFNINSIKSHLNYLTQNTTLPLLLLTYPAVTSQLKKISLHYPTVFIDESTDSIFHSIEYIRYCHLLISPDTATIHIASGLNKPIIGFYSNDKINFTHWHPNNHNTTHVLYYDKNINEIMPEQIKKEWIGT